MGENLDKPVDLPMIFDERNHEFWIARERDSALFACGDTLNLTRAHGETVRLALKRHLGTLEARARSLRTILAAGDPERAELRLNERRSLRTTQLIVRPANLDDEFSAIMEMAEAEG